MADWLSGKIRQALGPCSLGEWPTDLEWTPGLAAAARVEALWVKREDRSSSAYGGNKVRGLEFLLAGAVPETVYVTVGGTGSTHCLATAVHAARVSCRAVLAQFPQPETAASRMIADACERVAAGVVRSRSRATFPAAVLRAWLLGRRMGQGRVRWIPGGGAEPRAVIGHCLGGLELAPCFSHEPVPDAIVAPLGTGGTAAGLVLAMDMLGWRTQVVGVKVAPRFVANGWRVRKLARGAAALLRAVGIDVPKHIRELLIIEGMGRGYGYPTREGEAAGALASAAGLHLDPTYGAKAFAMIPGLSGRGIQRVVFWHTFSGPIIQTS